MIFGRHRVLVPWTGLWESFWHEIKEASGAVVSSQAGVKVG